MIMRRQWLNQPAFGHHANKYHALFLLVTLLSKVFWHYILSLLWSSWDSWKVNTVFSPSIHCQQFTLIVLSPSCCLLYIQDEAEVYTIIYYSFHQILRPSSVSEKRVISTAFQRLLMFCPLISLKSNFLMIALT